MSLRLLKPLLLRIRSPRRVRLRRSRSPCVKHVLDEEGVKAVWVVTYLASESGRTCWFAGSPSKLVRSLTSVLYMLWARFTHIDLNVGCLPGRNIRGVTGGPRG